MNENVAATLPPGIALLTKTAEHTHDVVIITDADGVPIWANEAFVRLSGLSLNEIATGEPREILQSHAAGRAQAGTILQALRGRQPVKTQLQRHTKNGDPVWFDLEISPLFDAACRPGGFVAIQRHISDCVERNCDLTKAALSHSKAEGRLRAAIEATSDGFAIYDENDRLLIANQAFSDIHQGLEDKIGPGSSFEDLLRNTVAGGLLDLGGDDPEHWIVRQLKMACLPSSEMHLRFVRGGWMSRRHERMENNEIVRIWTDINSLKRQQVELEEARTKAEAADRAKSQFLTNVSHEIRNMMNGVIGFNHLLLRTELSERQKEYATLIQVSSDSLMSLIDEILDLGKIEGGALEIEDLPFRLDDLVTATCALEALAKSKSITLEIECPLPADTIAVGDVKRIRQILVNLVGNAIKFTNAGHVRLAIAQKGDGLELTVSDTGRGIPAAELKAVFERFYQAGEPRSGEVQGSGLGLAIVRDLTQLMGGEITVASECSKGSTFKVWLPVRLDLGNACRLVQEQANRQAPNIEAANTYDVLVAEDHPINLKLALALLQAAGCRGHSAENGQQALAALENVDYDLIVMDSQMPIMTGIEAIRIIRCRPDWKCRIPILSLTADAMKGADEYHAMAGADMYMTKPLKSECFIEAVKRLAAIGRQLRDRNAAASASGSSENC